MTLKNPSPTVAWATISGLHFRYLDWSGDGPPILALHGLASSAHWYDLVAPLLRGRYRVIAPDQRGHGQSAQAGYGYDWPTLASDAMGLLDHLGLQAAAVVGHSWGANVALNTAALHPDRVSSLVMVDGGFFGRSIRGGTTWEEFSTRLSPRDVSGTRAEFLERMRGQLDVCWNPEVKRIIQTMVVEDEDGRMQDILRPENHAQLLRAMWDHPASETWTRVSVPSLLVPAGPTAERRDSRFAEMRREMVAAAANAIPNVQVRWIPETIHDIGYHKPAELADVIASFLARTLKPIAKVPNPQRS